MSTRGRSTPRLRFSRPRSTYATSSQIVELEDGSQWQIFPGDLDVTLNQKPEIELTLVPSDDEISSHMLLCTGAKVHVIAAAAEC